jgi:hypothetical protein
MNVKNLMSRLAFWKRKRPIPVGDAPTEKHISGLMVAMNGEDSSKSIDFTAGEATVDIKNTIRLKSVLTKTFPYSSAWQPGNNEPGILGGSRIEGDTWYHCFVIAGKNKAVDAGFSPRLMPELPAGYTFYRRVGSFKTGAMGALYPFYAYELAGGSVEYRWATPIKEASWPAEPPSGRNLSIITVPPDILPIAHMQTILRGDTGDYPRKDITVWVTSPFDAISNPTPDAHVTGHIGDEAGHIGDEAVYSNTLFDVLCDAKSQIGWQQIGGGKITGGLYTLGWVDRRVD